MCQFCVEHGEGKRWYLQAQNYSADLNSDLERRAYVVKFISGFDDDARQGRDRRRSASRSSRARSRVWARR